jgi:hypothetical protein
MSEIRVIPTPEVPDPPRGHARRKGPSGAWQVLVDGAWVSERALQAHEALTHHHGDRRAAAEALGLSADQFGKALKAWDEAMERSPGKALTPPPLRVPKAERPRPVKPAPETPSPPTPKEPVEAEPLNDAPLPLPELHVIGGPLDAAYRLGYQVGAMVMALRVLARDPLVAPDIGAIARDALDPPEPPELPPMS